MFLEEKWDNVSIRRKMQVYESVWKLIGDQIDSLRLFEHFNDVQVCETESPKLYLYTTYVWVWPYGHGNPID